MRQGGERWGNNFLKKILGGGVRKVSHSRIEGKKLKGIFIGSKKRKEAQGPEEGG